MSLFVSLLLAATPAHALSCDLTSVGGILPADGSSEVPVNVVPAFRIYEASLPGSGAWNEVTVTLQEVSTGEVFPADIEVVETAGVSTETWLVRPQAVLPSNTDVLLTLTSESGLWEEVRFATGDSSDLSPPEESGALSLAHDRETDEWGTWSTLTIGLAGGEEHADNWWKVEIADNPDFVDPVVRSSLTQTASFWDDPCHVDPLAVDKPGETWVRVTTVDIAGNASEATTAYFDGPSSNLTFTCGTTSCSTVGSPLGIAGSILALTLASFRRRRA